MISSIFTNKNVYCLLTNIKAAVESANKVQPWRVDERHVVARVDPRLLEQQHADPLSPLVQLRAGQRCGHPSLGVEQGEDDVVGRCGGAPSENLGNELMLERVQSRSGKEPNFQSLVYLTQESFPKDIKGKKHNWQLAHPEKNW